VGTVTEVATGLGGEDGEDEAGHLLVVMPGLAADLGVVNHARGSGHQAAQEGNTLRQVVGGDAPRLEHEDEDAGGVFAPRRADLVHGHPTTS
jgi:hypothetical protein